MANKSYKNARELLQRYYNKNMNTNSPLELREKIMSYIIENYGSELNENNTSLSIYVKDYNILNWDSRSGFVKIFYNEFRYAKEKYKLTNSEKALLLDLSEYVMYETNLLVGHKGEPLNLGELCLLLETDRKTLGKRMNDLCKKKMIHKITENKNNYYIVNPYLFFNGRKIASEILLLFKDDGYEPSKR